MNALTEKKTILLAFITAFTLSIYILEFFIPKPLPFLKLGLSNVMIVYLLFSGLTIEALIVTIAKTIIGGFFTGTIFNPTTIMSLNGGLAAYFFMFLALKTKINFSVIGISLIGSVMHNLAQLFTVKFLVLQNQKIFYLVPVLLILALLTGFITGYIALLLLKHLDLKKLYEKANF
ncbi:MAG TPA: Gx transporter family protein [Candidatus Cloacimonadota bacterium]|jgi:heptaprenyl diphosphate synthase|nr:Gx transporter family protein [Candidatus Cloacimonadales bacterium]HPY95623.1 Gx transporter family protein [Candidatus Cloacimonadota bacterium]HQB40191.1 Gx transporter family protein [Candidatus Cloacimonadota bacterium]